MATLLLTVVGGIVGGPVGAAIGGLAGQAIDRDVLFRPKGREGPRLSDLKVQTSSYGAPIARVFGTMRVAGSVVWATDLIETRGKSSAGKGQPTVATYSYAASFAVLLSARPIIGVRRIWADGNLLRGAAGDFKTQTGFRFYLGDEDQPVDPLIASAEGLALAPAHRGGAYVVFENLQLADFGNRIPSLTFELIADAAAVPVGAIAGDVSGGLVGGEGGTALGGFSAQGDSARDVLGLLATAGDGWFAPDGGRLALRMNKTPDATVVDAGYAVAANGKARGSTMVRSVAPIESVARTLSVAHYDPARDYQTGVQRAARPGAGTRTTRIDLPAAIDAAGARQIAEVALATAEAARDRRTIAAPWSDIAIAPGSVIGIAGEGGRWRVEHWSLEGMVLTLELVRLSGPTAFLPAVASPGRALSSPDRRAGTTAVEAFELPALDDTTLGSPRLLVAATGSEPGWRQAALLLSTDGGARYAGLGATAAPAVIGRLAVPPGAATAALVDRINSLDVDLLHGGMTLHPADGGGLDAGANLALIGDELLQFGHAEQIGPRRWRLGELWRGRRGTEAAIGGQAAGDRFVMIDADALIAADLPLSALGGGAIILATGVGDADPVRCDVAMTGRSVVPPSPVQLVARRAPGGDVSLGWVRRSRLGWRWLDSVDAPLGEEAERYRIGIEPPGAIATAIDCTTPAITIPAALCPPGTRISVRQIGTAGLSLPAISTITD